MRLALTTIALASVLAIFGCNEIPVIDRNVDKALVKVDRAIDQIQQVNTSIDKMRKIAELLEEDLGKIPTIANRFDLEWIAKSTINEAVATGTMPVLVVTDFFRSQAIYDLRAFRATLLGDPLPPRQAVLAIANSDEITTNRGLVSTIKFIGWNLDLVSEWIRDENSDAFEFAVVDLGGKRRPIDRNRISVQGKHALTITNIAPDGEALVQPGDAKLAITGTREPMEIAATMVDFYPLPKEGHYPVGEEFAYPIPELGIVIAGMAYPDREKIGCDKFGPFFALNVEYRGETIYNKNICNSDTVMVSPVSPWNLKDLSEKLPYSLHVIEARGPGELLQLQLIPHY